MTWDAFERELVSAFRSLGERTFLIVRSRADRLAYVQFAGSGSAIDAEASASVVSGEAVTQVLVAAGWGESYLGSPNWAFRLAMPALTADYSALASRCVVALRDVFSVPSPDGLVYQAWREADMQPAGVTWTAEQVDQLDRGDLDLVFPSLTIERIAPPTV